MDNATLQRIALATLPTGVVSLVVLLIAWWWSPGRRDARDARGAPVSALTAARRVLPVVLLALCATALYRLIFQSALPDFPPARGRFAAPYVGLVAMLAGLGIASAAWVRPRVGVALGVLLAACAIAGTVALTLRTQLLADGGWEKWRVVVLVYVALAGVFTGGLAVLGTRRGLGPALAACVIAFAVSQVLVVGYHSISESILGASLCAVVGGLAAATLVRPHTAMGAAGAVVLGVLLSMLILQGAAFGVSDMPWRVVFAAMIAVSPWAALGAEWAAHRAGLVRPWALGACMAAGAAALAITAVAIAGRMYLREGPPG
jgi:hypothetical protein